MVFPVGKLAHENTILAVTLSVVVNHMIFRGKEGEFPDKADDLARA